MGDDGYNGLVDFIKRKDTQAALEDPGSNEDDSKSRDQEESQDRILSREFEYVENEREYFVPPLDPLDAAEREDWPNNDLLLDVAREMDREAWSTFRGQHPFLGERSPVERDVSEN